MRSKQRKACNEKKKTRKKRKKMKKKVNFEYTKKLRTQDTEKKSNKIGIFLKKTKN